MINWPLRSHVTDHAFSYTIGPNVHGFPYSIRSASTIAGLPKLIGLSSNHACTVSPPCNVGVALSTRGINERWHGINHWVEDHTTSFYRVISFHLDMPSDSMYKRETTSNFTLRSTWIRRDHRNIGEAVQRPHAPMSLRSGTERAAVQGACDQRPGGDFPGTYLFQLRCLGGGCAGGPLRWRRAYRRYLMGDRRDHGVGLVRGYAYGHGADLTRRCFSRTTCCTQDATSVQPRRAVFGRRNWVRRNGGGVESARSWGRVMTPKA